MQLILPLEGGKLTLEFSNLSPDRVTMTAEVNEHGNPDYPKTYRPAQKIDIRTTREELREVVRNLDRLL